MAEELFTSATSPVPDELWKDAKSPVQRQLAAVEYWNDMNGRKEASARRGPQVVAAIRRNAELSGAGMMGTAMGAKSLIDSGGTGPTGRSRGESDLLAAIAQRQQMQKDRGSAPGVRDRLLAKRLEMAEYDRQNRGKAALRDALVGAAGGAGVGLGTRHLDKLGPLRSFYSGA